MISCHMILTVQFHWNSIFPYFMSINLVLRGPESNVVAANVDVNPLPLN